VVHTHSNDKNTQNCVLFQMEMLHDMVNDNFKS